MNSAWRNLCPDLCPVSSENEIIELTDEIIHMGHRLEFSELEAADIVDLLESHHETLTNEDLVELEQQRALESEETVNDEPAQLKEFTAENISEIVNLQDVVFSFIMK